MSIKEILPIIKRNTYFPKYSKWVFILLLFAISMIYNYQDILFKTPQSLHQWRQCDCLSITMNYYQDDNPFLEPSVHYLGVDGTGKTVSEFPIIYYSVAQLWKIFGPHEFIFRLMGMLFFFTGLFALFKIFENTLKDSLLAILFPLFLFTSPTLVYYANNFLMDIPALSLAMIGLYFFFKFVQTSANKHLFWFAFFYTLAGLLKISSLLSFMAIFGLFVLELFKVKLNPDKKIFQYPQKQIFAFVGVILVELIWYMYAHNYNAKHNSGIFLIGILPVWDIDAAQIRLTWDAIIEHIKWDYFRRETQLVFVLMFVAGFAFYKKSNRLILLLISFLSIGFLTYIMLFFQPLKDHDYYTINLFILVPVIILGFLWLLKERFNKIFTSVIFKILVILFLIHNVDFARRRIEARYSDRGWQNRNYIENVQYFKEIPPYLSSIGIKKEDKVLSLSDNSINVSLYLMNQKGWTSYGVSLDSAGIADKMKLGAKYLMLTNQDFEKPEIQPFTRNKIGEFRNIKIYAL